MRLIKINKKEWIKISVPKSQQTDKSDVCYLATQLELKVIRMVMNEKYFPKRARFVISNRLVDLAMDVSEKFDGANAIFPSSEKYLSDREELQVLGKSSFVSLKKQLNVAYQYWRLNYES